MARIYIYDCKCGEVTLTKEEFVKPNGYVPLGQGRYKINLNDDSSLDPNQGFPDKVITCTSCGREVKSRIYKPEHIPPVYYNYLGDDD